MKSKSFPLSRGGEKRIRVDWSSGYKKVIVWADNRQVAIINGASEIEAGVSIPLTCGADLEVQYVKSAFVGAGIQVRLNGVPVAGSMLSPTYLLGSLGRSFPVLSALQFAVGLYLLYQHPETADANPIGYLLLLGGIVNIPLAVFCFYGRRSAGLAGIAIYIVLFLMGLAANLTSDVAVAEFMGLIVPAIVVFSLIRSMPSKELTEWEDGLDAQFQGAEIYPLDGLREYPTPFAGALGISEAHQPRNVKPASDLSDFDDL